MPHKPTANGYDPRFTHENYRETGITWAVNARSIPMHTTDLHSDDKHILQNMSSNIAGTFANIKKFVQRYHWSSSQKQASRIRLSTKPSLSAPSPTNSNIVFILLCTLWYSTSALSSNTGKAILTQFRYPITLTFIQFGFVAFYSLLLMTPVFRFTQLRMPTKAIIQSTVPMGVFQVLGHVFSSMAISRIHVSTVHTIKALSPLFTVAAYALLFGVSYSSRTYISLFPLTIGVMLACSFDMSASNAVGLLCAFGSALIFVSSNIFFKKIMPSNSGGLTKSTSHKLDKLNLLLYSSSMAFLIMIPLWLYYDLPILISSANNPSHITHPKEGHSMPHSVMYYIFMNGTVHFAQNIIAFIILSSTSPVTYSIASLIKRVAVICIAIVWFNQTVHPIQALGIGMTFMGLYMYNNAKSDVEQGEKKMRRVEAARDLMLPTTKLESRLMMESDSPSEFAVAEATGTGLTSAYGRSRSASVASPSHHAHRYQQSHSPNLTVKITPPVLNTKLSPVRDVRVSPIESYPSPPLSLDSPPSNTISLDHSYNTQENIRDRQTYPIAIAVA